jgi:hypothetical protein
MFPRPDRTFWENVRSSVLEGLGVALFFWIFRPLDLGLIPGHTAYPLAYGGIVCFVTILYRLVFPDLFPNFYKEENWTVRKEIAGNLGILCTITIGIILFHHFYYGDNFAHPLFVFLLVTIIGSIPISLSVLYRFASLNKKYSSPQQIPSLTHESEVVLVAENGRDMYRFKDLYYVEITDNYSTVFYRQEGRLKEELIRSSLNKLERQLAGTNVVRCHRSYLVNLEKVHQVSGNAQGYKLHLRDMEKLIPVSRKYADIKDLFHSSQNL